MCGRYTINVSLEELILRYHTDRMTNKFHKPRYNVAPAQLAAAIIHDGTGRRMGELRWGLIPSWAKDPAIAFKTINARAEELMRKPSYRGLVPGKRCIIPATGFFEWKKLGADRQPMRFFVKDEPVVSLAGLYDTWKAPDGSKVSTFTIITTKPNALVAEVHDRMPAILRKEDEEAWLDRGSRDIEQVLSLLQPYPAERMDAYPVSKAVGNVKNDSPELIEKISMADAGTDAVGMTRGLPRKT